MILGAEPRVRTIVELVDRSSDIDLAERDTRPAPDHGESAGTS